MIFRDELEAMRRVLKRLEYIDTSGILTQKGRVACEINSGDELICTELIFSPLLRALSPEQTVALLSVLVFEEKVSLIPHSLGVRARTRKLHLHCAGSVCGGRGR